MNLTTEEARQTLRKKSSGQSTMEIRNPKLRAWVRRARSLVRHASSDPPSDDPLDLLRQLDGLHQTREREQKPKSLSRNELRNVRREQLGRIERKQNGILRKAGFEDAYALESALRQAKLAEERRRRAGKLKRELTITIDTTTEPEEVRELLEGNGAQELEHQLAERQRRYEETERALAHYEALATSPPNTSREEPTPVHQPATTNPPAPQTTERSYDTESQRQLDVLRMQLAVVETRIRHAMRCAQSGAVLRQLARGLLSRVSDPKDTPDERFRFLAPLTNCIWNTLELDSAGHIALRSDDKRQPLSPDSEAADLAWLATRLDAASRAAGQGVSNPLVLFADELLASPSAGRVFSTLRLAADQGIQILMLVGGRQLANQLAETDVPVVRVALEEEPQLRIVNA